MSRATLDADNPRVGTLQLRSAYFMDKLSALWAPRVMRLAVGLAFALPATTTLANAPQTAQAYDRALQRFQQNDLAGASVLLRTALQQDRRNLAAHLLLGRVLVASGDLKAAEASLEEAARLGVSNAEVWPLLGQVWLQLGESRKLLQTLQVSAVPRDRQSEILMLRGAAMALQGDMGTALAQFEEAKKLAPQSEAPWVAETPLLLRAGDTQRAIASARKAVELGPRNEMAWYQLATAQQALGDAAAAMVSIDRALALKPKLVDALVVKASLLLSTNKPREAAELLVRMRTQGVVEPRASFLRAILAESSGNAKQARTEYADAAALIDGMAPGTRANSEPLLLAGALAHRALGNSEQARAYTEQLLSRNPRHAVAGPLQARLLLDGGDVNKAASTLEALLRQSPNEPELLMLMGSVQMARRQYAQAAETFERAARGGAGNAAVRELALSQLGLRQDRQALSNLERAYTQNPRDTRAGIELAIFHARRGDAGQALKVADALVAQDPANPVLLNFLANVKGRLNDNAGMRATYERVLKLDPKFRVTIINLSLLDIDERKFDAARSRLQAWFDANPNDAEAAFLIGTVEERARRPAQALQVWAKVDAMQSRDPRAGLSSIDLLLNQQRAGEAHSLARSLSGRFPDSGPVQMSLARTQLATGDTNSARISLQTAARLVGFDPLPLVAIARLQLAAGHIDGAAHSVNKALQADPEHHAAMIARVEVAARRGDSAAVDAGMRALQAKHGGKVATLLTAGHLALSRRQFAQAVEHYGNAHRLEPGTPTALALSQAHLMSGAGPKALALLEDNARRQPDDPIALRALAEVQLNQGRNDAALKSFERLVALQPGDADLLITFAQILAAAKDSRAVTTAESAVKLAPANSQVLAGYGGVLVQAGQAEAAVRVLREARLREPANPGLRLQLAGALAKTGRRAEAQEELRAAVSAQPGLANDPGVVALRDAIGR